MTARCGGKSNPILSVLKGLPKVSLGPSSETSDLIQLRAVELGPSSVTLGLKG